MGHGSSSLWLPNQGNAAIHSAIPTCQHSATSKEPVLTKQSSEEFLFQWDILRYSNCAGRCKHCSSSGPGSIRQLPKLSGLQHRGSGQLPCGAPRARYPLCLPLPHGGASVKQSYVHSICVLRPAIVIPFPDHLTWLLLWIPAICHCLLAKRFLWQGTVCCCGAIAEPYHQLVQRFVTGKADVLQQAHMMAWLHHYKRPLLSSLVTRISLAPQVNVPPSLVTYPQICARSR